MTITYPVTEVYILLGTACNMKCIYCSQGQEHVHEEKMKMNYDIIEFLKNVHMRQSNQMAIIFYGGEPLVYWKELQEIREALDGLNNRYTLITNGSLLDQEKVDYLNKWNVHVQVSWDGPNVVKTRHYNVMEDKHDLLLQLNSLCFSAVMCANCYPLEFIDALDVFEQEYKELHPNRHANPHFDHIRIEEETELIDIDFEKWSKDINTLIDRYIGYIRGEQEFSTGNIYIRKLMRKAGMGPALDYTTNRCGSGSRQLHLGINGELYMCHNHRELIGTIYDPPLAIIRNTARKDKTPQINEQYHCDQCRVSRHCCNCYTMGPEMRGRYFCKLMEADFGPILDRYDEILPYFVRDTDEQRKRGMGGNYGRNRMQRNNQNNRNGNNQNGWNNQGFGGCDGCNNCGNMNSFPMNQNMGMNPNMNPNRNMCDYGNGPGYIPNMCNDPSNLQNKNYRGGNGFNNNSFSGNSNNNFNGNFNNGFNGNFNNNGFNNNFNGNRNNPNNYQSSGSVPLIVRAEEKDTVQCNYTARCDCNLNDPLAICQDCDTQ